MILSDGSNGSVGGSSFLFSYWFCLFYSAFNNDSVTIIIFDLLQGDTLHYHDGFVKE